MSPVIAGCHSAPPPETEKTPVVQVGMPGVRDVIDYVYFTGRLETVDSVEVQARATGYLQMIDFEPYKAVKVGDRLCPTAIAREARACMTRKPASPAA